MNHLSSLSLYSLQNWSMTLVAVRELLTYSYDDNESHHSLFLITLNPVSLGDSSVGMAKDQKIQLLLGYCCQHERIERFIETCEGRSSG